MKKEQKNTSAEEKTDYLKKLGKYEKWRNMTEYRSGRHIFDPPEIKNADIGPKYSPPQ